ncbi:MBL fold metallo-hydrolase [Defluviimonas aestuarii]|uniref:MBL fold metallo-hydrolase n=1 Tax=Albidovulum aestuarii TaxID=1130726 RepID=UPI00249CB38C|nr:MBL fold metallo-hydrolase [Defluviimonas aestuarii]MDI3336605.1 MBL fold metallo-hydrolase [Defluviimonas aestuarii]
MTDGGKIPIGHGVSDLLEPGLRRVIAPNPSPMTLHGTNSYIVGEGKVAVIDPGPANAAHLSALLGALAPGETIAHIFVTHAHLDHSPLARPLATATGAPVLAFGDALSGRTPLMERLAATGTLEGGEGVDAQFVPDEVLADGEEVFGPDWALRAWHTPGHFANHMCFQWGEVIFSGDHVMGWASSLVSPPDGDMRAYMASLDKLADLAPRRLHSGHGAPIPDARARISELMIHRREREAAIRKALLDGPADATTVAARVYTDTAAPLMRAAARNTFAHLIDLTERNLVQPDGELSFSASFAIR